MILNTPKKRGFTLVELLVVIAILSVLAAMLLPSLENSIYQARLLSCGNNLRQVGIGLISYTVDYDGQYPKRNTLNSAFTQQCFLVCQNDDDRVLYRPYFPISLLACPLTPYSNPNLLETKNMTTGLKHLLNSYDIWAGTYIYANQPASKMLRIGDKPTYAGHTFDILAADFSRYVPNVRVEVPHPDTNRALFFNEINRTDVFLCSWRNWDGTAYTAATRGPIDRNFIRQDGSLLAMKALEFGILEPRLVKLPYLPHFPTAGWYSFLPPCD